MIEFFLPLVLICTTCVLPSVRNEELPSTFKLCKRNADLNKCLEGAIQDALHLLKKDIPSLHFSSIDPFKIGDIYVSAGNGAVHLNQHFKNFKILGIANSSITGVNAQLAKNSMNMTINMIMPKLVLLGEYEFEGKLLALPLNGSGKGNWVLENVKTVLEFNGKAKLKKEQTYMEIVNVNVQYTPSNMKIELDNLFNGNAALSNRLNNLLNENWRDVHKELLPGYIPVLSRLFKKASNDIFTHVPYDHIFIPA